MKKVLSILGLIAILGITTPAFAGPHGPERPASHGPHGGGGHKIHAGSHHRPHIAPRHHGGFIIHAGYPRHSYRHVYRHGYWRTPWCDYRLGWGDPYCGYYYPMGGASFSIRF